MNDEENDAPEIFYITKEEFKHLLATFNTDLLRIAMRYTKLAEQTKNKRKLAWIQKQIEDIRKDIEHHNEMMLRADIEDGYLLFFIDSEGNISMRRCTHEEYEKIYGKKEKPKYLT
jgi:hypothetical protein